MPKFIDRTASGRFFHTHLAYLAGLKQPGGGRWLPPKTPSRRRYSMKTEFLQNLKVGEQSLPKEVIDAILAENGRDVEAAKKPPADYEHIKEQLATAQEALKGFEGVDVAQLQSQITTLNSQLADKDKEWQDKLDAQTFDSKVKDAITAAKGRNAKAIAALLDLDTLRASKNQEADIKAALETMKKDSGYLFEGTQAPPPYSNGTGSAKLLNVNKESFAKLGYRERLELKQSNPQLYEQVKE